VIVNQKTVKMEVEGADEFSGIDAVALHCIPSLHPLLTIDTVPQNALLQFETISIDIQM
jgi:hypothetical protein